MLLCIFYVYVYVCVYSYVYVIMYRDIKLCKFLGEQKCSVTLQGIIKFVEKLAKLNHDQQMLAESNHFSRAATGLESYFGSRSLTYFDLLHKSR